MEALQLDTQQTQEPTAAVNSEPRQPFLQDQIAIVAAPTQAWCGPRGEMGLIKDDGALRSHGVQGVFDADIRVVSVVDVRVNGERPEPISVAATGTNLLTVTEALRMVDTGTPDPTTLLTRQRHVLPGQFIETLTITCSTEAPVTGELTITLATDLATMEDIKQGRPTTLVQPLANGSDGATWANDEATANLDAPGAAVVVNEKSVELSWPFTVTPGQAQVFNWRVTSKVHGAKVGAPKIATPEWKPLKVTATDTRLAKFVDRSLADLAGLRMSAEFSPDDVFLAAGAPWYFTLFGRDSIWAARMLLPLGTELALGTLRTLAAKQGTKLDPETAEAPGKILHEVRGKELVGGEGMVLPPVYYGTIDATSLWVNLLHEAWQSGAPDAEIEKLLPALEKAMAWHRDYGDANGDGFLDYIDTSGHGLANQGWKDSGDSIQWRDGRLAEGPISLPEVQAYAYEAAMGAAELLDHFGRPGADEWREWAAALKARFKEKFWLTDAKGPYVALALDKHGAAVDSVASNMGHLLGTGLLDDDDEALIAKRLVDPELNSGYGLRTLATSSAGYWPLKYHGGSVWAHDTAIAVRGLARAGFRAEAAVLARGVLDAAEHFGYQIAELYGGNTDASGPLPYPASCHPQAWSAAAAIVLATSGVFE